jgi:hypothetical protein
MLIAQIRVRSALQKLSKVAGHEGIYMYSRNGNIHDCVEKWAPSFRIATPFFEASLHATPRLPRGKSLSGNGVKIALPPLLVAAKWLLFTGRWVSEVFGEPYVVVFSRASEIQVSAIRRRHPIGVSAAFLLSQDPGGEGRSTFSDL